MKEKTTKKKVWAIVALCAAAVVLLLFITVFIPMMKNHKNSAYNSKYEYDGTSLVGVWQQGDDFSHESYKVYEFREGGKVITSLYVYGIEAIRDELSTYRIEGKNTLIITYSIGGVLHNQETKFSISEDKSKLVLREGVTNTVLEKYDLEYNKDKSVLGEWVDMENSSHSYTFLEDYTGIISDGSVKNNILFSTNGDKLYFFVDEYVAIEDYSLKAEYVVDCKYKIENDVLTITIGDKVNTYQRRK